MNLEISGSGKFKLSSNCEVYYFVENLNLINIKISKIVDSYLNQISFKLNLRDLQIIYMLLSKNLLDESSKSKNPKSITLNNGFLIQNPGVTIHVTPFKKIEFESYDKKTVVEINYIESRIFLILIEKLNNFLFNLKFQSEFNVNGNLKKNNIGGNNDEDKDEHSENQINVNIDNVNNKNNKKQFDLNDLNANLNNDLSSNNNINNTKTVIFTQKNNDVNKTVNIQSLIDVLEYNVKYFSEKIKKYKNSDKLISDKLLNIAIDFNHLLNKKSNLPVKEEEVFTAIFTLKSILRFTYYPYIYYKGSVQTFFIESFSPLVNPFIFSFNKDDLNNIMLFLLKKGYIPDFATFKLVFDHVSGRKVISQLTENLETDSNVITYNINFLNKLYNLKYKALNKSILKINTGSFIDNSDNPIDYTLNFIIDPDINYTDDDFVLFIKQLNNIYYTLFFSIPQSDKKFYYLSSDNNYILDCDILETRFGFTCIFQSRDRKYNENIAISKNLEEY